MLLSWLNSFIWSVFKWVCTCRRLSWLSCSRSSVTFLWADIKLCCSCRSQGDAGRARVVQVKLSSTVVVLWDLADMPWSTGDFKVITMLKAKEGFLVAGRVRKYIYIKISPGLLTKGLCPAIALQRNSVSCVVNITDLGTVKMYSKLVYFELQGLWQMLLTCQGPWLLVP